MKLSIVCFPFSFLQWFQQHKDELWYPMGVGVDFVLAITFKPVFIFEFRFHLWSIFFLFIAYIQISAIFKTITCQAIIGSIEKMAIMAAMTCVYLAIERANIGVYVNSRKNVDPHWKRNWKICISLKVMAKIKLTSIEFWVSVEQREG